MTARGLLVPWRRSKERRGVALLTVLWVVTVLATLALLALVAARDAVAVVHNRTGLLRAGWRAEDCAARARAAIAEEARSNVGGAAVGVGEWAHLDAVLARAPHVRGYLAAAPLSPDLPPCMVVLRPAGTGVDVNAAGEVQLRRLLRFAGVDALRGDSLVAALLDWRDTDEEVLPGGAESAWYEQAGVDGPRQGPFAHLRELRRVRGFAALDGELATTVIAALTVEPARLCLGHATPAALASLPGMTDEAVARLMEMRDARRISEAGSVASYDTGLELMMLRDRLSGPARDSLMAHFHELVSRVVAQPDAWILTATGFDDTTGDAAATATLELRLVRAGGRVAVVRRRTNP